MALCILMAGMALVLQGAHAQSLVLAPPCTVASLTGSFGYLLSGSLDNSRFEFVKQVGILVFDGGGHFTNTFTQENNATPEYIITRGNVSQGTYTISSDCATGRLIFHGSASNSGDDATPCVFVGVTFKPTAVLALPPVTNPPSAPAVLLADAALACQDLDAQKLVTTPSKLFNTYVSTYTGSMTQQ